jgi:hypothetical protein
VDDNEEQRKELPALLSIVLPDQGRSRSCAGVRSTMSDPPFTLDDASRGRRRSDCHAQSPHFPRLTGLPWILDCNPSRPDSQATRLLSIAIPIRAVASNGRVEDLSGAGIIRFPLRSNGKARCIA